MHKTLISFYNAQEYENCFESNFSGVIYTASETTGNAIICLRLTVKTTLEINMTGLCEDNFPAAGELPHTDW